MSYLTNSGLRSQNISYPDQSINPYDRYGQSQSLPMRSLIIQSPLRPGGHVSFIDGPPFRQRPPVSNIAPGMPAEGSGLPAFLLNGLYAMISQMKDRLKNDLITNKIPGMATEIANEILLHKIPPFVCQKTSESVGRVLEEKLKTALAPIFATVMVDKFGPAISNVVNSLKNGNLVCSKPCICGQNPQEPSNNATQDAKFPEQCIDTCPCKQQKNSRCNNKKPCSKAKGGPLNPRIVDWLNQVDTKDRSDNLNRSVNSSTNTRNKNRSKSPRCPCMTGSRGNDGGRNTF